MEAAQRGPMASFGQPPGHDVMGTTEGFREGNWMRTGSL